MTHREPLARVEILRTDGSRDTYVVRRPALLQWIQRMIEADTIDAVNLRDGRVMLVDDHGWETRTTDERTPDGVLHITVHPVRPRKPINPAATALYHAVCGPGTTHAIAGDVAIAVDADFA